MLIKDQGWWLMKYFFLTQHLNATPELLLFHIMSEEHNYKFSCLLKILLADISLPDNGKTGFLFSTP